MEQEGLSFEEAFRQLEQAVQALETGSLTIDQMVARFEDGIKLVERCNHLLDTAELRISQLQPEPAEISDFRL